MPQKKFESNKKVSKAVKEKKSKNKTPKDLSAFKTFFLDTLFILFGSILYALSVNIFTAPNDMVPGGITGIGILFNFLLNVPIGVTMIVLNLPLVIISFKKLGVHATLRTAIATGLVSVIIDLTSPWVRHFKGDMIITVVFGGLMAGVGLGLIYLRGGTTGGSELLARLVEPYFPHIPVGRLILVIDAVVVVGSIFVFGNIENALYSIILIFVSSMLMDIVIYGSSKGKMVLIMSKKEDEIIQGIFEVMNRGVTKVNAEGAYTKEERFMILCVIRSSEFFQLKSIVYAIDPEAFVVVTNTDDVLGNGFKNIDHLKKSKTK